MSTITREIAFQIARQDVERLASAAGDSFDPIPEETKEIEVGWLFFFNSSDFVRSRNPVDALAGNGPLLVRRDGRVQHVASNTSLEDALKRI